MSKEFDRNNRKQRLVELSRVQKGVHLRDKRRWRRFDIEFSNKPGINEGAEEDKE